MARRSEHSQDEIRTMILDAAEAIVAESGATELKVRSIALEIGYTIGSIYMIFDNLADLALHLKVRIIDHLNEHLNQVPAEESPKQSLINLAGAYLNFAKQHYHCWQMISEPPLSMNTPHPDWYLAKFEPIYGSIEQQFRRLSHTETSTPDHKISAIAFFGGIHGICSLLKPLQQSNSYQNADQIAAAVFLFVENFVQGSINHTPNIATLSE